MHGIGSVERNDVHAEEREAGDRACGMANCVGISGGRREEKRALKVTHHVPEQA